MLRCTGAWIAFALLVFVALPCIASAQDATLENALTYVGPGPGSTSLYRYDYSLTNNAVTPSVIKLLVFLDSDPDRGVVFLGDNIDSNNTAGFSGSASGPAGWTADVFEDPDPNPCVVEVNLPPVSGVITSDCTGQPLSPVVVDLHDSLNELVSSTITTATGATPSRTCPPAPIP